MDNSKLLNWGLAAGAVAILAALVGYLFFWSSDETTDSWHRMKNSGDSACMKDGDCEMMGGTGGMMEGMGGMSAMGGMMGMMGGPTDAATAPLTIDQAADAAKRYLDDNGNADLKVKEVVEFTNSFYIRVVEQSSNSGALELMVNRSSGEVTSEPGSNMMWNNKYGAHSSSDGNDGMMDGGTCGMMGTAGGQTNASATTDMPVKKTEARDRAQKYLDTQFPGARAGEPDTFYGYYTVKAEKDGRTFGILSVNGNDDQVWYHAWLGVYLSGKQL